MSYSPWGSHKESDTTRHAGTHCYRSQGNGLGQSAWQEEEQMMLKKSLPLPFYIRSVSLFALSGLLVTRATAESAWEGATLLCLPRNCQSPLSQSPWPHSVLFPTGSLPEPSNPTKKVPRFPMPRDKLFLFHCCCPPQSPPVTLPTNPLTILSPAPPTSFAVLLPTCCFSSHSLLLSVPPWFFLCSLILSLHSITLFPCFCNVFRLAFVHLKHTLIYYVFSSAFP